MKKGFTLIELLAVVTLIGLLAVLIIPKITENINKKKSQISAANMKLLESATDIYIEKNKQNYASTYEANGSTYCIPIQSLIDESIITTPFKDVNGKEIDYTQIIEATYNANYNNFSYRLVKNGECTETINYVNRPQLADNMIPVVYDGDKWVKADINTKWYNYSEKNWANAVLVKESKTNEENSKSRNEYKDSIPGTPIQESDILAYFVWIPRFRYQLFSSDEQIEIKIAFENVGTKTMGTQTGEWLTHPAFTINNQELAGIWVGKYETSSEDSKPVIKKDKTPWTNIEFSSAAQVSSEMANQNNIYGLSDINTHLIKNDEWGAVAYLTNSKYGINAKMDSKTSTNTGDSTSTTGNMTGIYDMGGLSQEYVIVTEQSEETLGSSLSETSKWYDEKNTFITEENEYLTRGKSSILNYSNTDEKDKTSFRVALINNYAYPSIYPNQLQGDEPCAGQVKFNDDTPWECIISAVNEGKTENMQVGNEKKITLGELGEHTLRIANTSTDAKCSESGFSQTSCGFVLEFADIVTTHRMNETPTNQGGWKNSEMRKYLNCSGNKSIIENDTTSSSLNCADVTESRIYDSLPEELRKAIIDTTVVSGHEHGVQDNYVTTDKIYLLATAEIWENGTSNPISNDTARENTRQLDYYAQEPKTTSDFGKRDKAIKKKDSTATYWWLRSADSIGSGSFSIVGSSGENTRAGANSTYGVAPAFRIGPK